MTNDIDCIAAQAHLHHAYFLGLQLMISSRKGPTVMGDWTFRLFRKQHEEKFLSSFEKLGLHGLPDAVACARYHVLANNMGGVAVEFMPEHDRKAWVRFRYPRWMFAGPVICGLPVEVSRGFLNGWYAHNGVTLKNPKLGFVCVSEDMTGQFGLCGYFREFDRALEPHERLTFAPDEVPPVFCAAEQPQPPADWDPLRLAKANRNYAMDYVRNGLTTLQEVIGPLEASELGRLAARLIGQQYFAETAEMIGAVDGDVSDAADYLARMFEGMGDEVEIAEAGGTAVDVHQHGLRIVRGLSSADRSLLLQCWRELWAGALSAQQLRKSLVLEGPGLQEDPGFEEDLGFEEKKGSQKGRDSLVWRISALA
jgi:hypothetical protein